MKRVVAVFSASVLVVLLSGTDAHATFPGTNGKLAFWDALQFPFQVHTIDPDGSNDTQLTTSTSGYHFGPAWSADGTEIAFIASSSHSNIRVMNADGSGATTIVTSPVARGYKYLAVPAWSPDGTEIAFCAYGSSGQEGIFIANSDGSGVHPISGKHHDCDPAWSPDGASIAVDTFRDRVNETHITTMSPAGTGRTTVAGGGNSVTTYPSWSPDSASIVFQTSLGGRFDIYTVNADGTGLTQVTDTPQRWEQEPTYSPDGLLIAYSRTASRNQFDQDDVWLVNTDGTSPVQITNTPSVDEFGLDWQAT